MKTPKPKRLKLDEMWKLYLKIQPALDSGDHQDLLIDEVDRLLGVADMDVMMTVIQDTYELSSAPNPLEALSLFIESIKENKVFQFSSFVKEFTHASQ